MANNDDFSSNQIEDIRLQIRGIGWVSPRDGTSFVDAKTRAAKIAREKIALETVQQTEYGQLLWGAVGTETAYAFQRRTGGWRARPLKVQLNQITEFVCAMRRRLLKTLSASELGLATKAICEEVPEEYTENAGYFTTVTSKDCVQAGNRCR
jgi:hypothetical protein